MPKSVNDIRIGEAFNYLFRIILQMERSDDEDFIWNFKQTSFITPFFILPLMLYRDKCGKSISCINIPDGVRYYLDAINFDHGTIADKIDDFHSYMEGYSDRDIFLLLIFRLANQKTI